MKTTVAILIFCFAYCFTYSQINISDIKDKAQKKVEKKIDKGVDKAVDKVIDKTEDKVDNAINKKEKSNDGNNDNNSDVKEESTNQENPETVVSDDAQTTTQTLTSYTKYDFVPGDQVLFYEDFSQDAIGDFPDQWTSNSSGEVKTVNIANGKWFHMNGDNAAYCYMNNVSFPDNFIIEFDMIPDAVYGRGIIFTLYQPDPNNIREIEDAGYPGLAGLHITIGANEWETTGYSKDKEYLQGQSSKNTVQKEKINHIIIWVQKRRVRIYHSGAKVVDIPTNIYADTKFSRFRFSGWDRSSFPMISNFKVTTAAPDTRSKLLTDGKIISYGIYFDSGKDVVKPESYGTLNDISNVLKENPDVKIQIVGHTDSDGDDAANLDLSKRRAANVKNSLVKDFGIDASRIETDGKGEKEPIAQNSTPENKAKNRRVEFLKK